MPLDVDRYFWTHPEVLKLHNYQKLTLIFFLCVPGSNATEAAKFVGASPAKVTVWRQRLMDLGLLPQRKLPTQDVRLLDRRMGE